MPKLLAIALGGALGSLLRYALGNAIQSRAATAFPLGTLAVNVSGCFAIGLCAALATASTGMREEARAFLIIGLLGAFTTFSTYGLDTLRLAQAGELRTAALNVALGNVLGLAGVWLGARLGGL